MLKRGSLFALCLGLCATPAAAPANSSALASICRDAPVPETSGWQDALFAVPRRKDKGARDFAAVDETNVYSPSVVAIPRERYVFFGGWHSRGQTHDSIYVARCPDRERRCDAEAVVLNAESLGFEHLNDPVVVRSPTGLWLMYMTGVRERENGLVARNNHVYLSVSADFAHWSSPVEVAPDIWLPAATIGKAGGLMVYGNENTSGNIAVYHLADDGVTVLSRSLVHLPKFYENLDVRWNESAGVYQMLAETHGPGNQIDLLESRDGLVWSIKRPAVVRPHLGKVHARTPAFDGAGSNAIYYSETDAANATGNKICVRVLD